MILSYKPPYDITPLILSLVAHISEKTGAIRARHLQKQSPQLRKQNRIKTIHSSLQIEGNTLSEEQIRAIIDSKPVLGPQKDVLEVQNAIHVYEKLKSFRFDSEKSFLSAHKELMSGLVAKPGHYRNKGVGIVKGSIVEHLAPPAENIPFLMKDLFKYLKYSDDPVLIKSCVFHYELEFIHPFTDGNGRMGRLWQTVILLSQYPVFEFLPFESIISQSQQAYYNALRISDKSGKSTVFIEFILDAINQALGMLLEEQNPVMKDTDRLELFVEQGIREFTRRDYMNMFKDISTATASRDLKKGLELNMFKSRGTGNQTRYIIQ